MLHSDELEKISRGSLHAIVQMHEYGVRVAQLVDDDEFCWTHAITYLNNAAWNKEILTIDHLIKKHGWMIGKTFRAAGYAMERIVILRFVLDGLPSQLKREFRLEDPAANQAVVSGVELWVSKAGRKPILYGTTIEIDNPVFCNPEADTKQIHIVPPHRDNPIELDDLRGNLGDWIALFPKFAGVVIRRNVAA